MERVGPLDYLAKTESYCSIVWVGEWSFKTQDPPELSQISVVLQYHFLEVVCLAVSIFFKSPYF